MFQVFFECLETNGHKIVNDENKKIFINQQVSGSHFDHTHIVTHDVMRAPMYVPKCLHPFVNAWICSYVLLALYLTPILLN